MTHTPRFTPRALALTTLMAALGATTLLSACAPLLLGGAIVGSTMMVADRRTAAAQIEDQSIEFKSISRVNEAVGKNGHVSVTSYNRMVLITGEVHSEHEKTAVEQAVARIDNVRTLVNELVVDDPASLSTRSSDTLITSKVKASLVDAKDIQAYAFKVVTDNGVVFLMGRVTEREATRGAEVARGVNGVRKVVRVFEIISEAELADTQHKSAPKP